MVAHSVFPLAVVLVLAAAVPAQDPKQELEKLQGEWVLVSQELKGRKTPDKDLAMQAKLSIKGDQMTIIFPSGIQAKWTIKVDPSKEPKTIDLTAAKKLKGKEIVVKGIYKVDGDTLTLCRTSGDAERPKEFKTTPEAGDLEAYKRAKK